ncbi:MAG: alcohol dehydrogenase catalytic domain-containing protein [Spirochaetales bacterium]|nr:alcohol dehydrogenase catalytic domain-containing protein [Spirochaetales bacterium]
MNVPARMRAQRFYGPEDLRLESVETPRIESGEVLIRTSHAGVCGTDVRIYRGTKRIAPPRIIGHEFAGTIATVGSDIDAYREGDRVTVHPMLSCGECYACRAGRPNICVHRTTLGYEIDGGFAEFIRIPAPFVAAGNIVPVPDGVETAIAGMAEPFAAAYHGIRQARITDGQLVVIVGAGPIGLGHVQMATRAGARVVVVEPEEWKRRLALELGAVEVIDPRGGTTERVCLDMSEGAGADTVIVDVGLPEVIEEALNLVKKGGRFVIFAGAPVGSTITIDPNRIHYREIECTGSSSSTPADLATVLDLVAKGELLLHELLTEILPIDRLVDALRNKGEYRVLKSVVETHA